MRVIPGKEPRAPLLHAVARFESDDALALRSAPGIEDDRHWPIVDQLDLHPCSENPRLDRHAEPAERIAETLVERLSPLLRGCAREVRSIAPLAFEVQDERELAHDEGLSADVDDRPVEPTVAVLEDPEPRDLAGQSLCLGEAVTISDAKEDEQPASTRRDDPTVDRDRRRRHSLHHSTHETILAKSLIQGRSHADTSTMEAARNPLPALGALLLRDGAITPEQLEEALVEKRVTPEKRLGEILVERGYATRTQVTRVLAEQHELEFVELDFPSIEVEAAMLLPENLARRYLALPIHFLEDGSVMVAVADPTNVMFSDELRLALGVPIRVCVAAADAIETAINRIHMETTVDIEEVVTDAAETEDDATVLDLDHNTPAVVFINRAISKALDLGASDIHFTPQQRRLFVRIRVDGVMRQLSSIPGTQAAAVVSRLKIMGGLDIAERRAPQDGRVTIRRGDESLDVRMATLPTTYGEKVTLRMLSQGEAPDSLAALGLSPGSHAALERGISQPFGAVVVVGPTGSGKTTTLFTCLQLLNTPDRQLTTIEDPVEYRVDGLDQIEVNPRAGLTFASGLRTILRSDPDVLLVGEIRDEETAQIAFRAAMTGHLILTTLHAQTASAAMQRLSDMNIERSILATSINCIVGQRLARRVCRECCEATAPDPELLRALGEPEYSGTASFVRSVGCPECGGTGYRGRVPLFEVLTMTDEVALLVGAPTREIEAMGISQGMSTLREDGVRLAAAGITTLEEVRRVAGETVT